MTEPKIVYVIMVDGPLHTMCIGPFETHQAARDYRDDLLVMTPTRIFPLRAPIGYLMTGSYDQWIVSHAQSTQRRGRATRWAFVLTRAGWWPYVSAYRYSSEASALAAGQRDVDQHQADAHITE